jgi:hypothetical protein
MTPRLWLTAVSLGLVVSALFWVDRFFFALALAGPLAWGAFAGVRRLPWLWPVGAAVAAGLGAVVSDSVFKQEEVAFDFALTFTMSAFAWSAWSLAGRLTREDHRG